MTPRLFLLAASLLPGVLPQIAAANDVAQIRQLCLMEKLQSADGTMTVAQLRAACDNLNQESLIVERAKLERVTYDNAYAIAPHKPNYILPIVYNTGRPNTPPLQRVNNDQGVVGKTEAEFQISLKFPIIVGRASGVHWMGAYTNRSFWQLYNGDWSRPFRETNHEPETWVQFPIDARVPFTNMMLRAGVVSLNHQSNGQTGIWSRSWNRVIGTVVADSGRFALAFRPWWRIPEDRENDDNPDIAHYLGNFELLGTYRFAPKHQLSFMFRNNLETQHNRGSYELSYGFPLPGTEDLRLYVQAFTGYGKSLIDYNHRQTSIGFGIQLVDW